MVDMITALFLFCLGCFGWVISLAFEVMKGLGLFFANLFWASLGWVVENVVACVKCFFYVPESINQVLMGTYTLDLRKDSFDLVPFDQNWDLVALGVSLVFLLIGFFSYVKENGKSKSCFGVFFGILPIGITLFCVDSSLGVFVTLWIAGNLWLLGKMMNGIADLARG